MVVVEPAALSPLPLSRHNQTQPRTVLDVGDRATGVRSVDRNAATVLPAIGGSRVELQDHCTQARHCPPIVADLVRCAQDQGTYWSENPQPMLNLGRETRFRNREEVCDA